MIRFIPYNKYSKSCKSLVEALGRNIARRRHPNGLGRRDVVINWGCSTLPINTGSRTLLNRPEAVMKAVNKKTALEVLQAAGVSVPRFSTNASDFAGGKFLARQKLNGHSGEGIVVVRPGDPIPPAPLYTKLVKKDREFRVHVFKGEMIDFIEKRKRSGVERTNDQKLIRSYNNGWVFCREGVELPSDVQEMAKRAVQALGLDFGAVDICTTNNGPVVFEVNTSPATEGTTVEAYKNAILRFMNVQSR